MPSAFANAQGAGLGAQAVAYAARFIGVPYLWGGQTPTGFDCSGLVMFVYQHFGITLPRTSQEQAKVGQLVPPGQIQPGDLIFYSEPGEGVDSHVAIAVGGGWQIEAPQPGEHVQYSQIDWPHFHYARRPTGAPITPTATLTAADQAALAGFSLNPLSGVADVLKTAAVTVPIVLIGAALVVWGAARAVKPAGAAAAAAGGTP